MDWNNKMILNGWINSKGMLLFIKRDVFCTYKNLYDKIYLIWKLQSFLQNSGAAFL